MDMRSEDLLGILMILALIQDVKSQEIPNAPTDSGGIVPQGGVSLGNGSPTLPSCLPVTVQSCMDLGYNTTYFPSPLGHDSEVQATQYLEPLLEHTELLNADCRDLLKHFLCVVCMLYKQCNKLERFE